MKKHVKKVVSVLTVAVMLLSLAACGKSDGGSSSDNGGDSKDKVKIVVMPKVVGIDYYNAVQKGVDKASPFH